MGGAVVLMAREDTIRTFTRSKKISAVPTKSRSSYQSGSLCLEISSLLCVSSNRPSLCIYGISKQSYGSLQTIAGQYLSSVPLRVFNK